jgi:cysteine desulfurase
MAMRAYLDHAATTPLRPVALSAMLPFLTEHFGNPSGSHSVARAARRAVDDAREQMSRDLGCEPGELVFTANGTEADNIAVFGAGQNGSVVCSAVEHHAVLRPSNSLGATTVAVDRKGRIDLDALYDVLGPTVRLVSVMLANNEIGTVQPLNEVAALVRERAPRALLHTDAVAAVGHVDLASATAIADLVSISAHKFGGPKGAGALLVRGGAHLSPLVLGGEQERARRAGTHDVAAIVSMAAALSDATVGREAECAKIRALRDRLADGILETVRGAFETGADDEDEAGDVGDAGDTGATGHAVHAGGRSRDWKLPSNSHFLFEGVDSEELLFLLDEAGICASAGASCASGAPEPSHVLLAMGYSGTEARSAVRFSIGATTTADEVDYTLEVLPKMVERLRA